MFKHFILTRFNIKFDGIAGFDKNHQFAQTEAWLENRFYLFEKYCFPSIMNQTCKNFIWFVLFSSDTPERYIQKIKSYELQFPLFKPLFLETGDYDTIKKASNEAIALYLNDYQYIITSRIDNDDSFHKEMVQEVQKLFNYQKDTFLSFTYGLQYEIKKKVLARMLYMNNHFISRIEKNSNGIETVLLHDHTYIDKMNDIVYIKNKHKPMWLEIIHGGNLENRLFPESVPLFRNKILKTFNLNEKISYVNTLTLLYKCLKVRALLLRADLRKLDIYDFLKEKIKTQ